MRRAIISGAMLLVPAEFTAPALAVDGDRLDGEGGGARPVRLRVYLRANGTGW